MRFVKWPRFIGFVFALAASPMRAQVEKNPSADSVAVRLQSEIRDGTAAAQRGDWTQAIDHFLVAHLIAPRQPVPLYNLGLAQANSDNPAAAIAWWEAYLTAAPDAQNAAQVRGEIARLRETAIKQIGEYCENGRTTAAQISDSAFRRDELGSIERNCQNMWTLTATAEDDSLRFRLVNVLMDYDVREFAAGLRFLGRLSDSVRRDARITAFISSMLSPYEYSPNRIDYARAAANLTSSAIRKDSVLAAIADSERVQENRDKEIHARAELSAEECNRRGEGRTARDQALCYLRAGDLKAARSFARDVLKSSSVPRDEILKVGEAVRRIRAGDVEGPLQVLVSGIRDAALRTAALNTVADDIAHTAHNGLLEDRAKQLAREVPTADKGPSLGDLALAYVINEDFEAAFALSVFAEHDMGVALYGAYNKKPGNIADFLESISLDSRELTLAKIAFVAALRGRDREARRALDEATGDTYLYFVYRNTAFGFAVAKKFNDALRQIATWPEPGPHPWEIGEYHLSRAQVLAAIAARASAVGDLDAASRAVAAMPAIDSVTAKQPYIPVYAINAALDVADSYASRGDSANARAMREQAVQWWYTYRMNPRAWTRCRIGDCSNADARLSAITPTINRLFSARPDAAVSMTTGNVQLEGWIRAALAIPQQPISAFVGPNRQFNAKYTASMQAYAAKLLFYDVMHIVAVDPSVILPSAAIAEAHSN